MTTEKLKQIAFEAADEACKQYFGPKTIEQLMEEKINEKLANVQLDPESAHLFVRQFERDWMKKYKGNADLMHTAFRIFLQKFGSLFEGVKDAGEDLQALADELDVVAQRLELSSIELNNSIATFRAHVLDKNNPHGVTKTQIGLGKVNDTSDMEKPVSVEQGAAIARAREEAIATVDVRAQNYAAKALAAARTEIGEVEGTLMSHVQGKDNPHGVTKAQIGLDKVDNTSDEDKPVSLPQAMAITGAKQSAVTEATAAAKEAVGEALRTAQKEVAAVDAKVQSHIDTPEIHKTSAQVRAEIVESDIPVTLARVLFVTQKVMEVIGPASEGYNTLAKIEEKVKSIETLLEGDNDEIIERLQEVMDFINAHKDDIEALVTGYVKKTEIADNVITSDPLKVLSARQGTLLIGFIDDLGYAVQGVADALAGKADKVTTFTEAESRSNIESGENFTTILGKIRRWFADLKMVAFSGSYKDLDTGELDVILNRKVDTTDSRLSNSRAASDVHAWAKEPNKPAYTAGEVGAEDKYNKGKANGYASLDNNGKIPLSQINDAILGQMVYAGTFVPATGIATLSSDAKAILGTNAAAIMLTNDIVATTGYLANEGNYYICSGSGTFADIELIVGDWLVANETGWVRIQSTDAIHSVNGKTGHVNLTCEEVGAAPAIHIHADIDAVKLGGKTLQEIISIISAPPVDSMPDYLYMAGEYWSTGLYSTGYSGSNNDIPGRLPTFENFSRLFSLYKVYDAALQGIWFAEREEDLKTPKSLFLPAYWQIRGNSSYGYSESGDYAYKFSYRSAGIGNYSRSKFTTFDAQLLRVVEEHETSDYDRLPVKLLKPL